MYLTMPSRYGLPPYAFTLKAHGDLLFRAVDASKRSISHYERLNRHGKECHRLRANVYFYSRKPGPSIAISLISRARQVILPSGRG